jgi:Ni/Fe-hydrogenase 1 B-type cytochrome subunit
MAYTKADHPAPARIMHHLNLVAMVLLAITGFYIHKPNFPIGVSMTVARSAHFIAGFVLALNLLYRFYWAIFGGPRDIKEFLPQKENRGKLFPQLFYYAFLRKTHPKTAKYNPLQKMTYNFWFVLIIFQALTGFALFWKTNPTAVAFMDALGGMLMVRFLHYMSMWVFIVTVMIHAYLVIFEDFKSFMLMFFGVESEGH